MILYYFLQKHYRGYIGRKKKDVLNFRIVRKIVKNPYESKHLSISHVVRRVVVVVLRVVRR